MKYVKTNHRPLHYYIQVEAADAVAGYVQVDVNGSSNLNRDFQVTGLLVTTSAGVEKSIFKVEYTKATGVLKISNSTGTLAAGDIVSFTGTFLIIAKAITI